MTLTLRYMRPGDIGAVYAMEQVTFSPPWSQGSFRFEIEQSPVSHMLVLEDSVERPMIGGWQRFLSALRGQNDAAIHREIVGYADMWKIEAESHISTIATHSAHRGKGYGEILLAGMMRRALALKAQYTVLEVRVSNTVAQNLYRKYHFEIVDTKRGYYQNNHEDAYDMRVRLDNPAIVAELNRLYGMIQAKVPFEDHFSTTPHPRLGT